MDHPQRALELFLAEKRAQEQTVRDQKAADEKVLEGYREKLSPRFSAALAKVIEGDPEAEEFTSLRWEYVERMQVLRDNGQTYIEPAGSKRDIEMRTNFQGMNIHGTLLGGHLINFSWHSEDGSSLHGFSNLRSFGSAVASSRGIRAPYLEKDPTE